MREPMTPVQVDNLIAAVKGHRDYIQEQLERVDMENGTLLAKVVELEIQVGQLKMEAEEKDRLLEDYANLMMDMSHEKDLIR